MNKLTAAIADIKGINTNDPVLQRRVVKALEVIKEMLHTLTVGGVTTGEVVFDPTCECGRHEDDGDNMPNEILDVPE